MPRRSVAVVVAAVLAALVSVAAYAGLNGAQQTAERNARLTSVFVLTGTVPRGDSAGFARAEGLIRAKKLPGQLVPAGAVTRFSSISDHVALDQLPATQVVTADMFVAPAAIHSAAARRVPHGDVAVSVSTDLTHGVAGLLQPGDRADILVSLQRGSVESFLYQAVPVLAVDTTLVSGKGQSGGTTSTFNQAKNIITFAVPPPAAAAIALAGGGGGGVSGGLYLALAAVGSRSSTSSSPVSISGTTLVPGAPSLGSNGVPSSGGTHIYKHYANEDTP